MPRIRSKPSVALRPVEDQRFMKILVAALISEGLLVVFGFLLVWALTIEVRWDISARMAAYGVTLALAPLLLNHYLWRRTRNYPESVYSRFSGEIIDPLCRQISIPAAISIAILSGWCEEYFFRGALSGAIARYSSPPVACVLSSVLFAGIHFVGNFKRFGGMMPLYTLMGMYMWLIYYLSGSLFCVAVLHGSYNLAAILQVKLRHRVGA